MTVSRTSGIPLAAQTARATLNFPSPTNLKAPAAAPRISSTKTAPECQTIHSFVGKNNQAIDGIFGIGKRRDGTFKVVQCEVKLDKPNAKGESSKWDVSVQPVNEDRINPYIHVFTSNRKVKLDDFNKINSDLRARVNEGVKRLNDEGNRLPEPPKPEPPQRPIRSFQGIRDVAGGAVKGIIGNTVSGIGSVPERIGKELTSLKNTARGVANLASSGRISKNALNPILNDRLRADYNDRTNVEKVVNKVQDKFDGRVGADPRSVPYKVVEIVAPIVAAGVLGKVLPGGPPPAGAPASKLLTARQGKPVTPFKVTRSGERGITPVSKDISGQYTKIISTQLPNGSVKVTLNGRPMTQMQVVEAVASGKFPVNELGRSGYSKADIQNIMREAAKRKPPAGAGQAARTAKPESGNTDSQLKELTPSANQQQLNPAATGPLLEAAKPGAVQRGSLSREQLDQLAKEVDIKASRSGRGGSATTRPILDSKISTGQQNQLLSLRDGTGKPTAAAAVGPDLIRDKQGVLFDGLKVDYLSNGSDPAAIQKLTAAAYRQAQAEGVPLIISPASEALSSNVYVPKLNQLIKSGELGNVELLRRETRDGDTFFVIRPMP